MTSLTWLYDTGLWRLGFFGVFILFVIAWCAICNCYNYFLKEPIKICIQCGKYTREKILPV